MTQSGEELYRQYREGDSSAFDRLMELYRERLIFFLRRYLPRLEDAEDAAEDAFVALLLHPYRERRGASLKTYLFTLGRNRALNELKRQRRQLLFLEYAALPEEERTLEERVCDEERKTALLRALERLSPDYREALYLLYFEELSLEETARVMRKTKKQIENLSYRGRQALKERLGKEELFP